MYSCSAQLISFEIESTSKEINCAEHEYMNMSPSLIALAPLLVQPSVLDVIKRDCSSVLNDFKYVACNANYIRLQHYIKNTNERDTQCHPN